MVTDKRGSRSGSARDASVQLASSPRFEARREAFIDAATVIMNRDGASGMTLAEVANALGLTTPSVRYYFKKKEDLAAACLMRTLSKLEELFSQAAPADRLEDKLKVLITRNLELLAEIRAGKSPPLAVLSDLRAFTSQNTGAIVTAYRSMFAGLRTFFASPETKGMSAATLNQRSFLLLIILLWIPAWIDQYDEIDHPKIAIRIIDVLVNGLATTDAAWDPVLTPTQVLLGTQAASLEPEAFLVAATKVINEQGYRGASIDKISAKLNMTKGSFYHHHDAKDEFVIECFERTFRIVANSQSAAFALGTSGWSCLVSTCASLAEFQLSEHGPLLLNTAISVLPHDIASRMLANWHQITERFALMVSDGMIDGTIRTVDAKIAAQLINAAVNSVAHLPLWAQPKPTEDTVQSYLEPLFFGFASRRQKAV